MAQHGTSIFGANRSHTSKATFPTTASAFCMQESGRQAICTPGYAELRGEDNRDMDGEGSTLMRWFWLRVCLFCAA
ncbi:hypothetical protein BHYA_0051g00560 [Botrytis hyacinthi]|uniref:Uncharacterized protein n=1 Tax=Botrytis hyacinthi TaxID=278943 RepID=A0A4Z1GS76_9HELO|nr:hypothetical protein BHYA_0051g00560 [Botrytis hyacinthi]